MVSGEEKLGVLVRQMHDRAANAPWPLSGEDIRSRRRPRARGMSNPTIFGLVGAAIVVALLAVLVGTGAGSGGHNAHRIAIPPTATTTTIPRTTTTTTDGAPRVTVPELAGKSEAQAQSAVKDLGLSVGQIHLAPGASAAGTVISQAPNAGSLVVPGSVVTITVSSGPPAVGSKANSGSQTSASPGADGAPSRSVPTTPSTTISAPLPMQVSVTSVDSVLTPYLPGGGSDAGIPAEEVSFTVTGMVSTGQIHCSVEILQNGAVVGDNTMGAGEIASTQVATYALSTDVFSLSVPTFNGTPSDAQVACDS
jgi:hypothetical protein